MKKQNNENNKFLIIMCNITLFIGSILVYFFLGSKLKGQILIILVSYLPFILFLISAIITIESNNKRLIKVVNMLSIILTCILVFYYFIALFINTLLMNYYPVTNKYFYKHYIKGDEVCEKVFPENIPKNAKDVQFHYNPPFLQGSMIYYLYYVDGNMTLDKFDKKYKNKAEWVGHKNDYNEKEGLLSSDLLLSSSESYYERKEHENSFMIYLIDGKCDNSGYCNHGEYLLAAYNEKTKEIIYKSEIW